MQRDDFDIHLQKTWKGVIGKQVKLRKGGDEGDMAAGEEEKRYRVNLRTKGRKQYQFNFLTGGSSLGAEIRKRHRMLKSE